MLSITIAIPLKKHSERVRNKNFRPLGGKPLYMWAVETARYARSSGWVDQVAIFGRGDIRCHVPPDVRFISEVEAETRTDSNRLLSDLANGCDTDFVLMLNATSPFIRGETISTAVDGVSTGRHDSACTVRELRGRLWTSDMQPLNHNPEVCERTQDQSPIYLESDGFWLGSRDLFANERRRVGYRPAFIPVAGIEAIDIDTEDDWKLAEAIAKGLQQ